MNGSNKFYFTHQEHRLSYVDRGQGVPLVIVHGTPTNSSEYDAVIRDLSSNFRCVAIDHLGFGDSDKPADGDYSLDAHRARLTALLEHLGLKEFNLLVHDFGGAIGLPLAWNGNYTVKTITILNSWLWPLLETEPQMRKQAWMISTGLLPFFYRYFNFSARILIKLAWGKKKAISIDRHRQYIRQFPTRHDRSGTLGFLKALFDFENPNWHCSAQIPQLSQRPVQVIWGKADGLLSVRNLERWRRALPGAQVFELEDVGHFVAEESPDEVAARLRNLIGSAG